MEMIKAHWRTIAFSAIVLVCVGTAVWGYLGGSGIQARLETVQKIKEDAARARSGPPANRAIIEQRRKENAQRMSEVEDAENLLLAAQRTNYFYQLGDPLRQRQPIEKDVLPKVLTNSDGFRFRARYNEEFDKLLVRLRAAEKPSAEEITVVRRRLEEGKTRPAKGTAEPWSVTGLTSDVGGDAGPKTRLDVLRNHADSVAAYERALQIYMYAQPDTFARHRVAVGESPPSAIDIWQAQMALWIQQDMAAALAACNEERAAQFRAAGRSDQGWVAYMPVKHFKRLAIAGALGNGGESNKPVEPGYANSMTRRQNNDDYFVVPIQLDLIVEHAFLPRILDKLCAIGFYTPINVAYKGVKPNPLQTDYLYGQDPVVEVVIDLEGVFFQKVFGEWIPPELKRGLTTPGGGGPMTEGGPPGFGGVRGRG